VKYPKVIWRSFIDFFGDGGIMLAGSLSYFTMMAMVPFCLFLVTLFGYLLGQYPELYQFFLKELISFFPDITSEITKELERLITFKGIGTFSILLYGILSYQVFASIENALNVIFKVKKKRNILWSFILSLIVVTLIIIIIIASFMATSLIPLLKALKSYFTQLRMGLITGFLIQYVVPFFMFLFTIAVLYFFLPSGKIRSRYAFAGALFTTIFLVLAQHLFTWYIGMLLKLGTIYGSLTAFVIFLLWVFYSSCIFLIGAEIVHNIHTYKK